MFGRLSRNTSFLILAIPFILWGSQGPTICKREQPGLPQVSGKASGLVGFVLTTKCAGKYGNGLALGHDSLNHLVYILRNYPAQFQR